jgi:hypothetical protein
VQPLVAVFRFFAIRVELEQLDVARRGAHQLHALWIHQWRSHGRAHKQRKPHQQEAGEAVGVAQRLQVEHIVNYGIEGYGKGAQPGKAIVLSDVTIGFSTKHRSSQWAFDVLNKDYLGVEQMPRDAQAQVALATLHQQIEQMQAAQCVGGFGAINQAFQHKRLSHGPSLLTKRLMKA